MLLLTLSKEVEKFLFSLAPKQFKQVTVSMLKLMSDPTPHDSAALKGARRGERRVDIGEYRVIYRVEDGVIRIVLIGKRNDDEVYRRYERKP
ncbi:type II toxin-antitoxin system mRNA interferase toxin, RelE/StbE family [Massilia sp. R2A-15]|uniref:type II toxin-antitoxin system RelE family toxin n=1 Tax=Massilia sp. R2A-15 TaxID=3064278 RepID=UPI002733DB1C|nr:type II toxin-antitoxin system mRNA interferase toxin, RelE/StbE family [Massilia sp. R2A-15]WLI90278.1 type II toxin-antitoxin system mRNA interferase toxin, RelE/StbE family [Massilia sp. R2A-15]